MKFVLKANQIKFADQKIGELILIYDENLEFIDENWQINIDRTIRNPVS